MVWESNPGMDKRLFSSQKCPDQLWCLPNLLFIGYWVSFSGVNWPGQEVKTLPSSAEVKNEWMRMSAPTTYLHGVDLGKLNCSMSFTQEFSYMTEHGGIVVTLF
jgi:hypothetical protein